MPSRTERFDIQFMRGVAVTTVVLYHAFPNLIPSGFLGVDVFFVISGFLITGIILRSLEQGSFSFAGFYKRRAKRLLPASLTTLAVTAVLAPFILASSQLADYAEQLLGSLLFAANFVLSSQTGYFDGAAETKPLLHIWSLSLEEQFYFVAPLLLWLTPLRSRPWLLVALTAASLGLCWVFMAGPSWMPLSAKGSQKLAFFMLPTRAWEMLAGALCACLMLHRPNFNVPAPAKVAALAALLLICGIGFDPVHPRWDALGVVIATSLILLGRDGWLPQGILTKPVQRLGDISYSLYLVHWPLFSFAFVICLARPSAPIMAALLCLSVILAWMQYRFVELPFRYGSIAKWRGNLPVLVAASLAIAVLASFQLSKDSRFASQLAPNVGLSSKCDERGGSWTDRPECRTSDSPRVAIWGDSYAMHLVPGLRELPLVQMTKSACAPAHNIANVSAQYPVSWAEECVAFNEAVLASLQKMPSVEYVVISSPFGRLLADDGQSLLIDGTVRSFSSAGAEGIAEAVRLLAASGKKLILIGPTPHADFNAGLCNERLAEGLPTYGQTGCDIPLPVATRNDRGITDKLKAIGSSTGAEVLTPAHALCDQASCRTHLKDQLLYVDEAHLTRAGSEYLAHGLGLPDLLKANLSADAK